MRPFFRSARVHPERVERIGQQRQALLFWINLGEGPRPDKGLEDLDGVVPLMPIVGERQEQLQPRPLVLPHPSGRAGERAGPMKSVGAG